MPDYSLSKMDKGDLEWFLYIRNSARDYLHDNNAFTIEESRLWWDKENPDYRIIFYGKQKIGYFRIGKVEKILGNNLLWIGCDLDSAYRQQGHGYAVYEIFMPKLLKEFQVDGFILRVIPTNTRALNLYNKLGFKLANIELEDSLRTVVIRDIELVWNLKFKPENLVELICKQHHE